MLRVTTAAAVLAALALTAGCSSSSSPSSPTADVATHSPAPTPSSSASASASPFAGQSAGQIWTKAQKAMGTEKTVYVRAFLPGGGKNTVGIDLHLAKNNRAIGKITLDGHDLQVRRIGDVAYYKADSGFWRTYGNAQTARRFSNRWLKVSKGPKQMAQFFQFTNESYFTKILSLTSTEKDGLVLIKGITVGGKQTVGLSDTPAGAETTQSGRMFVAATGRPLPLELLLGKTSKQFLKFRDWNEPFTVPVPAGAFNLDPYLAKSGTSA